jgi:hypothetical protein
MNGFRDFLLARGNKANLVDNLNVDQILVELFVCAPRRGHSQFLPLLIG